MIGRNCSYSVKLSLSCKFDDDKKATIYLEKINKKKKHYKKNETRKQKHSKQQQSHVFLYDSLVSVTSGKW